MNMAVSCCCKCYYASFVEILAGQPFLSLSGWDCAVTPDLHPCRPLHAAMQPHSGPMQLQASCKPLSCTAAALRQHTAAICVAASRRQRQGAWTWQQSCWKPREQVAAATAVRTAAAVMTATAAVMKAAAAAAAAAVTSLLHHWLHRLCLQTCRTQSLG